VTGRANCSRQKRVAILHLRQARRRRRGILTELKTRRLQAVRSGPWKLAVTTQANVGSKSGDPAPPRLYYLDADIGETNIGPGVRPCGHVDHPVGLWLPGKGPD